LHPERVFPEMIANPLSFSSAEERRAYCDEKISDYKNLWEQFLKNQKGLLIVSNLAPISYSPLGIQEEKTECSLKDMEAAFNAELKIQALKESRMYISDFASFISGYGQREVTSPKYFYIGDMYLGPAYIPKLAEDCMKFIKPYAGKSKKCIVLDLDGTLWGGIVGEDGMEGIQLDTKAPGNAYLDFQNHLLALNRRGILLAINSKNNPEDALKVIREHPHMALHENNFASIKINWNDKAENIKKIAEEINIGIDSLVYIDDDPLQRERIRSAFPEVLVVDMPRDPALYVRTLRDLTDFNTLQLTEEDFKRAGSYVHQQKINDLKSSVSSLADFLRGLNIKISIMPADDFTVPRIAQLTNKTNQFNLTTCRYTEEEIDAFRKSQGYQVYALSARDRFGDHGTIGVAIIKEQKANEWLIDTFLMSCRVIGRDIEKGVLASLAGYAKKRGVAALIGEYIPTAKNSLCKNVYARAGFTDIGGGKYRLEDYARCVPIEYITVTEPKIWNA
jgi:FkbH-like protein